MQVWPTAASNVYRCSSAITRGGAQMPLDTALMHRRGRGDRRGVAERRIGQAQGPAPTIHRVGIGQLCRGGPPCPPPHANWRV